MRASRPFLVLSLFWILAACPTPAQNCKNTQDLPSFVDCMLRGLVATRIRQTDTSKQVEAPSVSQNSTALADQSAAPDIIGGSFNPSAFSSKSRTPNSTDTSLTLSLYGVYAGLARRNPFDDRFYGEHSWWRRLSFSLGRSFPEDNTATAAQGNSTYAAKYTLTPTRDVGDPSNANKFDSLVGLLEQSSQDYANSFAAIRHHLYQQHGEEMYLQYGHDATYMSTVFSDGDTEHSFIVLTSNTVLFQKLEEKLTPEDLKYIETALRSSLDSSSALTSGTQKAVDKIKNSPQLSVGFQSRISKGNSPNLYRAELALDWKFWKLSSTTNLSYDFQNAQMPMKLNRSITRFVYQIDIPLMPQRKVISTSPVKLSLSGEGDWGTNGTPIYKAQGKLRFTPFSGFEIPIVVTYANRTASVARADLKGLVGLTIDVSKLSKTFSQK
jgi:hypothetical protein